MLTHKLSLAPLRIWVSSGSILTRRPYRGIAVTSAGCNRVEYWLWTEYFMIHDELNSENAANGLYVISIWDPQSMMVSFPPIRLASLGLVWIVCPTLHHSVAHGCLILAVNGCLVFCTVDDCHSDHALQHYMSECGLGTLRFVHCLYGQTLTPPYQTRQFWTAECLTPTEG